MKPMIPRLHLVPALSETALDISTPSPIRVVLAEDHALVRRSLRLLLDREEGVEVIAEADDMAAVTRDVQGRRPHVLVLDLHMPGGSSIDAIGGLHDRVPETQIVVTTMQENPVFAQCALAAGALGFVAKDLADSGFPQAVRAAARGEEYVSPRVAQRLQASRARTRPARNLTALPDRREASAGTL